MLLGSYLPVERGSDKHGPRLDESLDRDVRSLVQGQPVEARAQEGREQEGPAEREPTPDARVAGGRLIPIATWPTDDEVEARAELARHLEPSGFPARPEQLRRTAAAHHAPAWIIDLLSALPDEVYDTVEDVWVAVGGSRERRSRSF